MEPELVHSFQFPVSSFSGLGPAVAKARVLRLICIWLVLVSLAAALDKDKDKGTPKDDTGAAADKSPATASAGANRTDYVIGDGDILAINVWHEAELSRVLPVRPDGKISLPLLGDVQATGLSPSQLQAKITQDLRNLLENPEVTVIVQESRSKRFSIVGEVIKPGSYELSQRLTILDALALAGGFRDFAKVTKIYVLRVGADGATQRLPFNYKRAIAGDLAQNFPLEPRDTVVVP